MMQFRIGKGVDQIRSWISDEINDQLMDNLQKYSVKSADGFAQYKSNSLRSADGISSRSKLFQRGWGPDEFSFSVSCLKSSW